MREKSSQGVKESKAQGGDNGLVDGKVMQIEKIEEKDGNNIR